MALFLRWIFSESVTEEGGTCIKVKQVTEFGEFPKFLDAQLLRRYLSLRCKLAK